MNKLDEIKERLNGLKQKSSGLMAYSAREYFHEFAEEDVAYLISLLKEKDKTLQDIMNIYEGEGEHVQVARKMWQTANEALNTSSNTEGK